MVESSWSGYTMVCDACHHKVLCDVERDIAEAANRVIEDKILAEAERIKARRERGAKR